MSNSDNIATVDKNLEVATKVNAPDVKLYDVRKPPFQIYGLYEPQTEPVFKRMPSDVAEAVNEGVKNLHLHTSGGRVRFSTDSPYVVIKVVMPKVTHFGHMPMTASSGFDLYIDSANGRESIYRGTFVPPYTMTDGYESKLTLGSEKRMRYVTINFPLYNPVNELYVGVAEGSTLGEGAPYRDLAPVVYYGSSITQGGCASRPGNAYTSMVGRMLQLDHVNLGFSGNGKAEDTMVAYLAGLKMSAFVSDYDHNAPNPEHLLATHRKMYETIRAAQPTLPYIMLSKPDFFKSDGARDAIARRNIIIDTFRYAKANGDENVYFIDGEGLFRGPFEDSCTVDNTHPNDLGFSKMADAVACVLRRVLRDL